MTAHLTHPRAAGLMLLSAASFTANMLLVRARGDMGCSNMWLVSSIRFLVGLVLPAAGITAGIGQLAMTRSFRDLPVAEGSLIQMLVPLGTALGGMMFFGERFTVQEFAGAALGTAYTTLHKPATANAGAE